MSQEFIQKELIKAIDAKDYGRMEELFKNGAKVTAAELAYARESGDEQLIDLFVKLHGAHELQRPFENFNDNVGGLINGFGNALGSLLIPKQQCTNPTEHQQELHSNEMSSNGTDHQ